MAGHTVTRAQVLAFRARAHSLDRRRPARDLLDVVAACGIQDTPPGNADVSLAARLDIGAPTAGPAIESREVAVTWAMRGAPHLVPAADLPVFTLGARPGEDTVHGQWGQPAGALAAVERAMVGSLRAKPRSKAEVSGAATASLPAELAPYCRPCDIHHPAESLFRAAPSLGRIVLASTAPVMLVRAKVWLGSDAQGDPDALGVELVRRYLHCYGPSTPGHFAEWAGVARSDAAERWEAVTGELVPVRTDRHAFVLAEDLDALKGVEPVRGVLLLPAKDVFLQARDRELMFADKDSRRAVFPQLGGPGVVLVDGEPRATWRGAAKGRRYEVRVEPLSRIAKAARSAIEAEAERVAGVRGHESATVTIM